METFDIEGDYRQSLVVVASGRSSKKWFSEVWHVEVSSGRDTLRGRLLRLSASLSSAFSVFLLLEGKCCLDTLLSSGMVLISWLDV